MPRDRALREERALRCYEFCGLKSLILTRADKDDPRVKAARLDTSELSSAHHPGMDTTRYYYLQITGSLVGIW